MTRQIVIENPILNSPFDEPSRHFKFSNEGITNEIVETRRTSAYFIPVPRPRKRGRNLPLFETGWTEDRIEPNNFVNQIRASLSKWRMAGRPGTTRTTAGLLEYWLRADRERRLFFCQIEALETAIYLAEAAAKQGDRYTEGRLHEENEKSNPLLFRVALKMATGSGKTLVMAMLIAWQALNKFANPQDARFSDAFLVVTPGITIRDRLRVLLPNDPDNYYRKHDLLPTDLLQELCHAKITVTNFHQMKPRERVAAGKITKDILTKGGGSPFTETPDQMVRRVCRGLRRMSYAINSEGKFEPEYAEVYGVPFSFIPCSGSSPDPKPGPIPTRVRALEDRIDRMIRFPRVIGYKYELPSETLRAAFSDESCLPLSTAGLSTKVQVDPIVGEKTEHTLDDLKKHRENEVVFCIAKRTLDKYLRDDDGAEKPWLFPKLLPVVRQWVRQCVRLKDKAAKVETARTLWVPAINNHGGFGHWAFIEITDPWNAKSAIRAATERDEDKKHE